MLDDGFQSGTDTALNDLAQRPRQQQAPAARFSTWGMLTAIPRGITAAVGEAIGSAADVAKAFGAASALTLEAQPGARAVLGAEAIAAGEREGRRQIETGEATTSDVGLSFRSAADFYRPDPVSAHAAERVVFDLARAGSKVIGGALAAGPFGIAGAGLEESITKSEELRREGVDLVPRMVAGAVQGSGLALGAALGDRPGELVVKVLSDLGRVLDGRHQILLTN